MSSLKERVPQERETLVFSNKEQAQEFSEQVAEKIGQPKPVGVHRDREMVAEVVAEELASHGHPVGTIKEPWTHTAAEHEEVQRLVNLAFAKDLSVALKQLRNQQNYPRLLDLFHDVLTGEMYDATREHRLNQQPTTHWWVIISVIIVAALLLVMLLLII